MGTGTLFPYLGNINSLYIISKEFIYPYKSLLFDLSPVFFISLTLSAYLSVFKVCSADNEDGEKLPIITVLQLPTNESLSTRVSLLPLKGV